MQFWGIENSNQQLIDLDKIDWGATDDENIFGPPPTGSRPAGKGGNAAATAAGGDVGEDHPKDEGTTTSTIANDFFSFDPSEVKRAETAPMVLTLSSQSALLPGSSAYEKQDASGAPAEGAIDPSEAYRYTEEYHELYFSQTPRDPRMLPPLTRRGPLAVSKEQFTYRQHHQKDEGGAATGGATDGERRPALPTKPFQVTAASTSAAPEELESKPATPTAAQQLTHLKFILREHLDGRESFAFASVKGHIVDLTLDQDGSRLVQRLMDNPNHVTPILDECLPVFDELCVHVFANYVIQKAFEVSNRIDKVMQAKEREGGSDEAAAAMGATYNFTAPLRPALLAELREARLLQRLMDCIRGKCSELATHMYGGRVVQKAVGMMSREDFIAFRDELQDKYTEYVFDASANHVIQKMIEARPELCQCILDDFLPRLREISFTAYGCRVLQRAFEVCCSNEAVNTKPLLEEVIAHINELCIHQYGNYVVQHAMLNAPPEYRKRFVALLTPQFYALSCSKFASNVAEKVIAVSDDKDRDAIVDQMAKPLGDAQGGNYLVHMLLDTYANYVVQRFLERATTEQCDRLVELVMPYTRAVGDSVYGQHLLRKMESMGLLRGSTPMRSPATRIASNNNHNTNMQNHPNGGGRRNENNNRGAGGYNNNNNNNNNNHPNNNPQPYSNNNYYYNNTFGGMPPPPPQPQPNAPMPPMHPPMNMPMPPMAPMAPMPPMYPYLYPMPYGQQPMLPYGQPAPMMPMQQQQPPPPPPQQQQLLPGQFAVQAGGQHAGGGAPGWGEDDYERRNRSSYLVHLAQ